MDNEMNYIEEIEIEEPIEVMDPVEVDTEESGIGAGVIALACAGGAAAIAAAVHWGKKWIAKHKEKKALRKPDADQPVELDDEDVEKVVTEDTEK